MWIGMKKTNLTVMASLATATKQQDTRSCLLGQEAGKHKLLKGALTGRMHGQQLLP
jgi:hypothetical protein